MILLIFLILTSWIDFKTKQIPVWIFVAFGILSLIACDYQNIWEHLVSMGIGLLLLILHFMTRGAIGEGDGWFFIISGLLLKPEQNLLLFIGGILTCFCFSLYLLIRGRLRGQNMRKTYLPFIPFLLPAGIYLVML